MSSFCEQVVKRKFSLAHKILLCAVGLAFAAAELFCIYVAMAYTFPNAFVLAICVALIAIAVLIFMFPRLKNVEFDYSVMGNTLSVDKVTNASKRKKVARVEVSTIEALGKLSDEEVPNYKYGKQRDVSDGTDEGAYFCVYTSDKGKCLLIFSPNEKIMNGMKPNLSRELVIKHFYNKK